jgi:hypothetical protein
MRHKAKATNGYAKAAIIAVELYTTGKASSPQDAWFDATCRVFGRGSSGQKKVCPRSTFLGLCEAGLIKGIPGGYYSRARNNKQYALDAVAILRRDPALARDPVRLWTEVAKDRQLAPNGQLDVVIALWCQELLA